MKFALLLLLLLQLHVLAAAYALPKTMKAVRAATKCNKPFSCVKLATVPVPTPRAGQVLIRLNGSSVNPSDVDTVEVGGCAKGCGADVSGTVVAVGSAARGAAGGAASGSAGGAAAGKVGDEVWGVAFSGGAYAEYVLAATADVSLRPAASAVGAAAAGTVPEVGLTSLFSLKRTGSLPTEPIPAGSPWSASKYKNLTVLITAGSGGTGFIGIEIAKAYGAKHIFTSTTGAADIAFCKKLGADYVTDYKKVDIFASLPDNSVDVVYDNYGAPGTADKAMRTLRKGGVYLMMPHGQCYESHKQAPPCISAHPKPGVRQLNYVTGPDFESYGQQGLQELAALFTKGSLITYVDKTFTLSQAAAAFSYSAGGGQGGVGEHIGKISIVPDAARLKTDDGDDRNKRRLFAPPKPGGCNLFVDPLGSDQKNNGRSVGAPFLTLQHAVWTCPSCPKTSCNNCRAGAPQKRTVCLRSAHGPHTLPATVAVGAKEGGLTVTTYPADLVAGHGRAVLSGGVLLGGFKKKHPAEAWLTANVANSQCPSCRNVSRPSLLYLASGTQRLQRARLPKLDPNDGTFGRGMGDASTFKWVAPLQPKLANGTWPDVDKTGFRYNVSDLKLPLYRQSDVQVLHFHSWTAFWSNISSISNGVLTFSQPTKTTVGQWAMQGGQRYLLENVKAGLTGPGDWYWDAGSDELLLIPPAGYDGAKDGALSVVAPQLSVLLQMNNVAGVTLRDLEFAHASVGDRVDQYYTQSTALKMAGSSQIRIERVAVRDSGGVGISVEDNVKGLEVLDSAVLRVGASGIEVPSGGNVTDLLINNTLVNDTARIILGQPGGIRVKGQSNITVTHNTVGFHPYAGIMIGWEHITEKINAGPTIFEVADNHVHNYGLGILSDFGGIYLSSADNLCFQKKPPTCHLPTHVHHNRVQNCHRYNYGCQGIYMDEQVSGVIMESNILSELQDHGFYFHCGSDNVAHNNIIAFAGLKQHSTPKDFSKPPDLAPALLPGMCNKGGNPTWPTMGSAVGFNYSNNIALVASSEAVIASYASSSMSDVRKSHWSRNVYWSANASIVRDMRTAKCWPNGTTLASWSRSPHAARGAAASQVVDPHFVDAPLRSMGFGIKPDSPAIKLGFVPIDMSGVGCSGNPFGGAR